MKNLGLSPALLTQVKTHFKTWRPVQEAAIELMVKGSDLIVRSPTGSGKSHAFLLPLLERANNNKKSLIIVPTKEIAIQLKQMAFQIDDQAPIGLAIGGRTAQDNLIVVATPGRLLKELGKAYLNTVDCIVIDEVEMVLDHSFRTQIDLILAQCAPRRQIVAFGALIKADLKRFLRSRLNHPHIIDIGDHIYPNRITNYLIPCRSLSRIDKLIELLHQVEPSIALIFVATQEGVSEVASILKRYFPVVAIHSALPPREREGLIKRARTGEFQYIVCSDLFSRGIDIPGVSDIFNYDLGQDQTYFYHRLGRTGRAELTGNTYTLYQDRDIPTITKFASNVKFIHADFINGTRKTLRPLIRPKRTKTNSALASEIRRIKKNGGHQVKPGYKKKIKEQIAKAKKDHRKKIIATNIKARRNKI